MTPNASTRRLVHALSSWFRTNARDLPWRRTRDPYAVWISEIMLQQTQVKTVIPYWNRWMRRLPDVRAFARARPETALKLWEGLGYYSRVRHAQQAARVIVSTHGGAFPEDFEAVLALPGVGRYTAGAICSIAFHQPTPILDGNVIRVLTRVFGIAGNPRGRAVNNQLWHLAGQLVATASAMANTDCSVLNQSLMELGALVCTPRQPQCPSCPVRRYCVARRTGRTAELPMLPSRAAAIPRRFVAFVVKKQDKFLVRQRPAGAVNAHLWEFPNVEVDAAAQDLTRAARPFVLSATEPLCSVRHSITRHRILLEAYPASLPRAKPGTGVWRTLAEMAKLPFTSAHGRIRGCLDAAQRSHKTSGSV